MGRSRGSQYALAPSALLTDLYQLPLRQESFEKHMEETAAFARSLRSLPMHRGVLLPAGSQQARDCPERMQSTPHERRCSLHVWWLAEGRARSLGQHCVKRRRLSFHRFPTTCNSSSLSRLTRLRSPLPCHRAQEVGGQSAYD